MSEIDIEAVPRSYRSFARGCVRTLELAKLLNQYWHLRGRIARRAEGDPRRDRRWADALERWYDRKEKQILGGETCSRSAR